MNKYILLRAEDAEKMQVELKVAIYFSSSDGKRHIHEALALIPAPIEVSEEAREFVNEFFGIRVNGYAIELPYGSLNEWLDKAAAMLAVRDKARLQGYIEKIKNEQVDAVNTGDASDEAYNQALENAIEAIKEEK